MTLCKYLGIVVIGVPVVILTTILTNLLQPMLGTGIKANDQSVQLAKRAIQLQNEMHKAVQNLTDAMNEHTRIILNALQREGRLPANMDKNNLSFRLPVIQQIPETRVNMGVTSSDWRSLEWTLDVDIASWKGVQPAAAVNAIDGKSYAHNKAFSEYSPFVGKVLGKKGLLVDFMGFLIPENVYCNPTYMSQPNAHAIRVRQCGLHAKLRKNVPDNSATVPTMLQFRWPVVAEEYFEYVDVLDSVSEYVRFNNGRKFTFVELGAGYGHWTFTAHRALMQKAPHASFKYVMVDVVDELIPVVREIALLNGVSMTGDQDSQLNFHLGLVADIKNESWARAVEQGQHVAYTGMWGLNPDPEALKKVHGMVSFAGLLDTYGMPCELDMVDIDIQESEFNLFLHSNATLDVLTARAHRVHIGTHGKEKYTRQIEKKFHDRGWTTTWNFPNRTQADSLKSTYTMQTPMGPVAFGDGILSFHNKNVLSC